MTAGGRDLGVDAPGRPGELVDLGIPVGVATSTLDSPHNNGYVDSLLNGAANALAGTKGLVREMSGLPLAEFGRAPSWTRRD